MMQQLSEQAQRLVDEFKKRVRTIPADERDQVIQEMTQEIKDLNQAAQGALRTLQGKNSGYPDDQASADNVSEYL